MADENGEGYGADDRLARDLAQSVVKADPRLGVVVILYREAAAGVRVSSAFTSLWKAGGQVRAHMMIDSESFKCANAQVLHHQTILEDAEPDGRAT